MILKILKEEISSQILDLLAMNYAKEYKYVNNACIYLDKVI